MSLEAVMICLDNSEWMRNGDYSPTRFQSQTETLNYLTEAKLRNHQDSTVGLLSMAGKRIEVHVAPCRSPGKVVKALTKEVKIGGKSDVLGALKTAQLALKNRQNKNLRQRIILFVGSPIEDDVKQFIKLGKIFKKHNIAVDVINFGEENISNENVEKLEALVNTVKNGDNSHFLNVPPGPHDFSDLVLTSGIMHGQAAGGFGGLNNLGDLGVIPANLGGSQTGTGGTGNAPTTTAGNAPIIGPDGIAVDPNIDPETYMAMKASLEEEYQRQQRLAKERETKSAAPTTSSTAPKATSSASSSTASSSTASSSSTTTSTGSSSSSSSSGETPMETEDEDVDEAEAALLQQALQMSIQAENEESSSSSASSTPVSSSSSSSTTVSSESEKKGTATVEEEQPDLALALSDPNFLNSLLESVPGVNKDQISMDSILEGLQGTPTTPEETQGKKPKKKPTKPGKKGGKKRKDPK